MGQARVLVLYTGGTIGMVPRDALDPASPLVPAAREHLERFLPDIPGIAWELRGLGVGPLDSASIGPRHWLWMAEAIGAAYDGFDGFVVLHGTDTMAFTAAALSFLLENLGKPVVLTGAQRPIFAADSDAPANLADALTVAGLKPAIPEVVLCFGGLVLRGNRTVKASSIAVEGFASPNYPPLARRHGGGLAVERDLLQPPPARPLRVHGILEPGVGVLTLYPGITAAAARAVLGQPGLRGCVLRAFGAGNAPADPELLAVLAEAGTRGLVVAVVSQCAQGRVEPGLYAAGEGLTRTGFVGCGDMTAEAALAKLMWLLADRPAEAAAAMAEDTRGELTV